MAWATWWHGRSSWPWRLLLVTFLAHGLLIPWLGFYWDDWTPLLVAHMPGASWREFVDAFWQNRPASGLLFWALMRLIGTRPWVWHGLILVLRWLTAWAAAVLVARVWPRPRGLAWWTGVFLAVYPAFRLQPVAVAFTPHLLSFALTLASLLALWQGWHARERARWLWWAASWIGLLASLLLLEYYLGLEVARGLLLAYLARTAHTRGEEVKGRLLGYGLPYLAVLALGLGLLAGWSRPPELSNGLRLLRRYPGLVLHSLFYMLFSGWFSRALFDPALWKTRSFILLLGVGGLVGLTLSAWAWYSRPRDNTQDGSPTSPSLSSAFSVGLILTLTPLVLFWVNGRFIANLYSDRFGLPALAGASLLWAVFIVSMRKASIAQGILVASLLTAAGHTLFTNAWEYRKAWREVRTVYAQLTWRAPGIVPGTALLGEGAQARYIAKYAVGESLNVLYAAAQTEPRTVAYWYYAAPTLPAPSAQAEPVPLETRHKIWTFRGDARHSMVFISRLARQRQRCVWVLTPEDATNPYIPDEMRPYTAYADPTRIQALAAGSPAALFGIPEQAETWCYFYEKAELARQDNDWDAVLRLWAQAQARGLTPLHVYEYRSFILAFARQSRWDEAAALSLRAWKE
ncbi:MAG: hypothetical protein GXO54_07310, partial [Chloroflexi bacterium]|nr:hypothetical protein [Chloroflexota bacterium]